MKPFLDVKNLTHAYHQAGLQWQWRAKKKAVLNQINFSLESGSSIGLIGESGSGKSTLARLICGLVQPTSGQILLEGRSLQSYRKSLYHKIQLVFQNSRGAMNPRKTVGQILQTQLRNLTDDPPSDYGSRMVAILGQVGLSQDYLDRYAHELSGGQAQRIGIAKALISRPKLLVLDEPTSALDVSVQAQILNLLKRLQQEYQLTLLFISHDLAVVEYMCSEGVVLKNGKIIEQGDISSLYYASQNTYVQSLMNCALSAAETT